MQLPNPWKGLAGDVFPWSGVQYHSWKIGHSRINNNWFGFFYARARKKWSVL
jgi:hypothetical protein